MATLTIPISPGVPSQRQHTVLDGVDYAFTFRWSAREGRWYMDLADSAGNVLIGSAKLVANFPLLHSRRGTPGIPPGELYVIDVSRAPHDPGLTELGDTHALVYREGADLSDAER